MNKHSILLVDDEEAILYALGKDLQKEGYIVESAYKGKDAIEKLRQNNFDLTISDLMLGDINGVEVLKAAKKKSDAPVIVITGHGELSSAIESLRLGAFDYLEKPCDRKVFISKVKSALKQYQESSNFNQKIKLIENEVQNLQIENSSKEKIVKLLENNQEVLEANLEEKNTELKNKNIALAEVLFQMEKEKEKLQMNFLGNVETFIFPLITRIKKKSSPPQKILIKLLEGALNELGSTFGVEISKVKSNLSQKELEICHMIRHGLGTKEISETLNISSRTVDTHRVNIRKKLDISNEKVNLFNYLRDL